MGMQPQEKGQVQHVGHHRGERVVTFLTMLVLLLVSCCLFGIIYEPDGGEYIDRPAPVVTAADSGSNADGPKIVGGFVPERHLGPPPIQESPVFLSWNFINGLFVIIILCEIIVFPLLFWLWFGRQQHLEE